MKKILFLGPGIPPIIGPSIAIKRIFSSTLKSKFDLNHFNSNVHASIDSLGTFRFYSIFLNIKLYCRFIYRIIKFNPDLILVPISQTTLGFLKDSIYIVIGFLLKKKIVIQLRGSNWKNWQNNSNFIVRFYTEKVIGSCKGAIVQGNCLRYLFEDSFESNRIFVIPNGIKKPYKKRNFFNNKHLKLLYLGNLQPSKGILDVINGIKLLSLKFPDLQYTLDVVGSWRDNKTFIEATKIISENNLDISFHGTKMGLKKEEFLLRSDVLIFTPREPEGMPWVIIEAISSGLPVIATSQGAIKEAVIDNENGFIVKPNSPEEIAEKVKLLFDLDNRKSMSLKSYTIYKNFFTEDEMVKKYKQCFEYIISN